MFQVKYYDDANVPTSGWAQLLFFVDIPGGMPAGPAKEAFPDEEPQFAVIQWFDDARSSRQLDPLENAGCNRLQWHKHKDPLTGKKNVDHIDLINLSSIVKVVYIVPDLNSNGQFFHLSTFKSTAVIV
jgi:hypothetical protein